MSTKYAYIILSIHDGEFRCRCCMSRKRAVAIAKSNEESEESDEESDNDANELLSRSKIQVGKSLIFKQAVE